MAYMIRLEGIESYGLYMQFADMLHTIGGYQEYDLKKISLMLGHTKKNIKAKLERVINDYELFEFYTEEDGIEMIGLERLKEDIASLNKHKENGAKGGRKRAENYRNNSISKDLKLDTQIAKEIPETSAVTETSKMFTNNDSLPEILLEEKEEHKLPERFKSHSRNIQLSFIDKLRNKSTWLSSKEKGFIEFLMKNVSEV